MDVLQPESVWIKEALETITLKTGKSCHSPSIKETHFIMQVTIKNTQTEKNPISC